MTLFRSEKGCLECRETKPLADFYAHPKSADGRAGICKDCQKARMKRRRLTNPAVQEYERERYHEPARKARLARNAKAWRKNNPMAYRAHTAVGNAVRDGRLLKEPCALCGTTENVQGHHKDYGKPLEVTWLCAKCHHRIHATFPELGGHFQQAAE
jgi:hypothetical protein